MGPKCRSCRVRSGASDLWWMCSSLYLRWFPFESGYIIRIIRFTYYTVKLILSLIKVLGFKITHKDLTFQKVFVIVVFVCGMKLIKYPCIKNIHEWFNCYFNNILGNNNVILETLAGKIIHLTIPFKAMGY